MAYQKTLIEHIVDSDKTGGANGARLLTTTSGDTLAQNVPIIYDANGNLVSTATRTGNTTKYVTHDAGGFTAGNVPVYDAAGNLKDSGSAGGGGANDVPWVTGWTEPVGSDFTITNDSGSGGTFDESGQGIFFYDAKNTAGLHMGVRSAPSTPYTIRAALLPFVVNSGAPEFGIGWRESSAQTKHTIRLSLSAGNWVIASTKWTSADSPTDYTSLSPVLANPSGKLLWFQITDDGTTNRTVYFGYDGEFWQGTSEVNTFFHQVSRTDFLTPDQVLFFIDSSSASFGCGVKLVDWTVT